MKVSIISNKQKSYGQYHTFIQSHIIKKKAEILSIDSTIEIGANGADHIEKRIKSRYLT